MKTNEEIFSEDRLAMLSGVRKLLQQMSSELRYGHDYSTGIVTARLEVAADAVFDVMNNANAHFDDIEISDEILFGRPSGEAELLEEEDV